ncbi:RluA family pseudouridine synthase [Hippea jasoniae]|uniref:RluA family pseudouridine synthase n=1 Tax=Hippea jasoniae TaxID=944479 RepID=UPI0005574531|nr:RluA family pseudouridine synthase [Hippea jasoniae]
MPSIEKTVVIDKIDGIYIGKRIDKVLSEILDIPRNQIQQWIKEGLIRVCDKQIQKSYKLSSQDCLIIDFPKPKEVSVKPAPAPIKILYEDDDVVVVDKPAGFVVHPGAAKEEVSVISALLYMGIKLSGIGAPLRGGVVHRIDKDTSGVIVLAKSEKAHFYLSKQFFEHTIDRRYIGITSTHLKKDHGIVDKPIARHPKDRKKFCVSEKGKNAKTEYKVLKRLEKYDIVMFKLFTGRTHQIRVHMKYLNAPLLGDVVYSKKSKEIERQALHAFKLGFVHPSKERMMVFYSKLPEDMMSIINRGWK